MVDDSIYPSYPASLFFFFFFLLLLSLLFAVYTFARARDSQFLAVKFDWH
jgi:hypothetical protein